MKSFFATRIKKDLLCPASGWTLGPGSKAGAHIGLDVPVAEGPRVETNLAEKLFFLPIQVEV